MSYFLSPSDFGAGTDKRATAQLSGSDKKKLRFERRIGYIFMAMIYMFGGLFNTSCLLIADLSMNLAVLAFIDIGILILGVLVVFLVNRQVNEDLKSNTKGILIRKVKDKYTEKSHEAGSGTLYSPILGYLFQKLWGQRMRETTKHFVVTESYTYEVEKDEYELFQIGETIHVHYGKASGVILMISSGEIG